MIVLCVVNDIEEDFVCGFDLDGCIVFVVKKDV